jgi:DNA-binding NarL/FixJ family response regulator
MTTTAPALVRVLLVDDHPTIRTGLRSILSTDELLEVVGEAGSALAGAAAIERHAPDIVLLDLGLPDVRGVGAVRTLLEAGAARVLVLSGAGSAELVRECLQAGAHGFLLKTALEPVLHSAIHRVIAGERVVDDSLIGALFEAPPAGLTPRELEVLREVADGCTNRRVASRLGVSEDTIKTHLSRAMEKLGASDRTHAIAILLRRGLLD